MPMSLKASRTRILSLIILCLVFYFTYKYVFHSETGISRTEVEVPIDLSKRISKIEEQQPSRKRVLVTVFYECLCPDSRSFFLHHLWPTFEKAPNLIDVELVPFGKASYKYDNGDYRFHCQHGRTECDGNKIHACAIEKIKDPALRLKMTTCMINDNMSPVEIGAKCSETTGVPWQPILDCANSNEGSLLLKQHGDKTNALSPPASFIPTILFNKGRFDQAAVLKNLWAEVCKQYGDDLPSECLS